MCVINVAVLYNLICVPGRMVFWELDNMLDSTWMVLDYICDFLYILDTLVRMHEGYLEQGLLVRKPNLLACKNICQWLRDYHHHLWSVRAMPFLLSSRIY